MSWVPLHVHSQYSILDATASVAAITKKAAQCGMPAVALTDHGNLFGAVDFYKAACKENVKPIIGCELYVAPQSRLIKQKVPGQRVAFHLGLLAKDQEGYRNLCILSSAGYLEGFYYYPRIDKELLKNHAKGLICLSGCLSGSVAQAALLGNEKALKEEILWYRDLFGDDYYLELQRHRMRQEDIERDGIVQEPWLMHQVEQRAEEQEKVNEQLICLAKELNIPLVATNDSHYIERDEWQAHEVLLNIQSGEPCEIWEKDSQGNLRGKIPNPKRRVYSTHECYFKSPEEMQALFADVPEAISNTLAVAAKCNLELDFATKHYPVFIPPSLEGTVFSPEERQGKANEFLKTLCEEGIQERYTQERLAEVGKVYPGKDPMEVVKERLEWELSILIPKGLCDYLLIVYDFISWAKRSGIPVGPGRGSGAGSIVLYLIGITDIEPLRFKLFFERFINPERISYPDIDVDICMEGRPKVIDYTLHKYGKENVAQIITFGTMKAKMAIKDVGRVLNVPLTKVNAIAKLVPEELDITLEKALEIDPDLHRLYLEDGEVKRIIDLARQLEGSIRNTGIHAAGVIISGDKLTEHIPICHAKDSDMVVTQFSMKPSEAVGMLKMDFLGLKTLTCIEIAARAVQNKTGTHIDWANLPLDDQPTFDLLNQGKTLGVFQLESGGMQELARNLHLDRFEEIIAVGALYRPGPMEMIPSFINRKHGREPIQYDHPWMESILAETYGIMVYQEQVMQIASTLANYSLGEGDVLRRAMGKKDREEMARQREKFRQGCLDNGISSDTATAVFDQMEKFAAYGFNKSHAAAYGYLTYVTAYFKANHPKEWMAALMTCDRDDLTDVAKFIRECMACHIQILPPDINEAATEFVATDRGIRFALTGIKGVGEGVVEVILEERKKGPFLNLYDFFKRLASKKVGKKVAECLVDAGAFDFTGWSRDALRESIEEMYEAVCREQKDQEAGFLSLFGDVDSPAGRFVAPPQVKNPTRDMDKLFREKELLGFFLTDHPLNAHRELLQRLSCVSLSAIDSLEHQSVIRAAFIIETVQTKISSKQQRKFAILTISDGLESYELPIWADLYEEKQGLLTENRLVYAVLQIEKGDGGIRLSCRWLEDLASVDEKVVASCDEAYDKAKLQAARFASFPKKDAEKKVQKKEEPSSAPMTHMLTLTLDAEKCRLSHILALKALLGEHPGDAEVVIKFKSAIGKEITLTLDPAKKVATHQEFLSKIRKACPVV